MKKFLKTTMTLLLCISTFFIIALISISKTLPSHYKVTSNSGISINSSMPLSVKIPRLKSSLKASTFKDNKTEYNAKIMLLNSIPVKSIDIELVDETKVIPCGNPFGIKIFTDGVVIVGVSDVISDSGNLNPAKDAGLKKGDVIVSIDNKTVNTNEDVEEIVESSQGNSVAVLARRKNINFSTDLKPVKCSSDGAYKAGLWVRDSSAGIGTLTFFDLSTGKFAGLGHGICDLDTGDLLPLSHGDIVKANINGVIKSEKGRPGELRGYFCNSQPIGKLCENCNKGIYGTLEENPSCNDLVTVAMKQQVKIGEAKIITTIEGEKPEYYDIDITNVNYNENFPTKNMIISIKDERLLNKTGGIVQGMSGSPIIQDGMLVGAITHVFVNEPNKGYAIFAENMLLNMKDVNIGE